MGNEPSSHGHSSSHTHRRTVSVPPQQSYVKPAQTPSSKQQNIHDTTQSLSTSSSTSSLHTSIETRHTYDDIVSMRHTIDNEEISQTEQYLYHPDIECVMALPKLILKQTAYASTIQKKENNVITPSRTLSFYSAFAKNITFRSLPMLLLTSSVSGSLLASHRS